MEAGNQFLNYNKQMQVHDDSLDVSMSERLIQLQYSTVM